MNTDTALFRLRLVGLVIVFLMAALVARLWFLQSTVNEHFKQLVQSQSFDEVFEPAPRGRILDVNGLELVRNRKVNVVSLDLQEYDRALPTKAAQEKMLGNLAIHLSRNGKLTKVVDLVTSINSLTVRNRGEVTIAADVNPDLYVFFGERQDEFPGVKIKEKYVREYPYGGLAAHILGYVGLINQTELASQNARWQKGGKQYLPNEEIGKQGVELLFEDELRGTPGRKVYEVDRTRRVIRELDAEYRPPIPGNDVYLTVDIHIQNLAEQELRNSLEIARATPYPPKTDPNDPDPPPRLAPAGSIVILDPDTSNVVAMASYPTYNPGDWVGGISDANYQRLNDPANARPLINRAINASYAPGSTFKLFTAFAGMTKGPNDSVLLSDPADGGIRGYYFPIEDPGFYQLPDEECDEKKAQEKADKTTGTSTTLSKEELDKLFTTCRFINPDRAKHSGVNVVKALSVSSDTYFYEIGANFDFQENFKRTSIQYAAAQFGFGAVPGSGLPEEVKGILPDEDWLKRYANENPGVFQRNYWVLADTVQLGVGQGLMLATPTQLANAYAAFANGGSVHAVSLAAKVTGSDGSLVREFGPRLRNRITELTPEVRVPLEEGLRGAVSLAGPVGDRGTAYDAFHNTNPDVPGIAFDLERFPIAGKTGTAEVQGLADNALFVGYNLKTPAQPKQYVTSVILEQTGFGGEFAAPAFARLYERLMNEDWDIVASKDFYDQCDLRENGAKRAKLESKYGGVSATRPAITTTTEPPATTTTTTTSTTRPTNAPPTSRDRSPECPK